MCILKLQSKRALGDQNSHFNEHLQHDSGNVSQADQSWTDKQEPDSRSMAHLKCMWILLPELSNAYTTR